MDAPRPDRRMEILGLHHVTAISADLDRTVGFYRDVLGLALAREAVNHDDPDARHFWFEAGDGTLVSFLEYREMEAGRAGPGAPHHLALRVGSVEELRAWREYLETRGVPCSDVLTRGGLHSVYLRDPDGHLVELAAAGGAAA